MLEVIFFIVLEIFISSFMGFALGYVFIKRKNNSARRNVEPFWFR